MTFDCLHNGEETSNVCCRDSLRSFLVLTVSELLSSEITEMDFVSQGEVSVQGCQYLQERL